MYMQVPFMKNNSTLGYQYYSFVNFCEINIDLSQNVHLFYLKIGLAYNECSDKHGTIK